MSKKDDKRVKGEEDDDDEVTCLKYLRDKYDPEDEFGPDEIEKKKEGKDSKKKGKDSKTKDKDSKTKGKDSKKKGKKSKKDKSSKKSKDSGESGESGESGDSGETDESGESGESGDSDDSGGSKGGKKTKKAKKEKEPKKAKAPKKPKERKVKLPKGKKPLSEKEIMRKERKKAERKEMLASIFPKTHFKEPKGLSEKNQLIFDTPRYLLPSELKRIPKSEKRRREREMTKYLDVKQEPYRCVRTCIDPKTAKIKLQEYICYPPPPCPPHIIQHPQIAFPEDCKCKGCSPSTCGSKICEGVRELKSKINYEDAKDCEPITICVPVPDPPPPQMICTDCPLEIRAKDGDFHIVNEKNFKKHIKKMNKRMKKVIEEWERKNEQRKAKIRRFCQ